MLPYAELCTKYSAQLSCSFMKNSLKTKKLALNGPTKGWIIYPINVKEIHFKCWKCLHVFHSPFYSASDDDDGGEIIEPKNQTIPVVGLLIHGIPAKIDLILFYLRKKMPVVVVKGSGGCADLLAFAFEEIQDR